MNGARAGCGPLLQRAYDTSPLRQQIFEYVRAQGQAARADITEALGISAGSATTLTADLIAGGHLREIEHTAREAGRGRPKVALEVVPEAAFVIGIKLAFAEHTAVLVDVSGNVVADASSTFRGRQMNVEHVVTETENLVGKLIKTTGLNKRDIRAIGMGLPGMVDHATGRVVWSPLLHSQPDDLSLTMERRFGVPVLLDNDANMLTLAELWFGEGRRISDFAVVTVESGVGMGLVLDNKLYRGAHGMGSELGHTKVQLDGALCQCGKRGCLEAYLADYALVREAATALGQEYDPAKTSNEILAQLMDKAKSGHRAAETIFTRAGRYLALGLSNIVQLFDPEMIILSGGRMQKNYLYAHSVIGEMNQLTLNEAHGCTVTVNAWDDLVWARGAAALALSAATPALITENRAA